MSTRALVLCLSFTLASLAACDDDPVQEICDDGDDNDGDGDTDCADSSCSAAPACDATVIARDDDATTEEDVPLVLDAATLLDNDGGPASLEITSAQSALGGTVALDGGEITFTPAADQSGAASFTYTIEAGGESATATVRITVTAVDDPPVAGDDALSMREDTVRVLGGADLLGNDVDVDSEDLTIVSVQGAVNGTAVLTGGNITFTPTVDFTGAASFTYTMSDGRTPDTATVSITVIAEGDGTDAVDDAASTDEDVVLTIAAATLLANDSDPDGSVTVQSVQGAVNGAVELDGTDVVFTPADDFFGTASFTYTAGDATSSDTATVTVTVDPVDDAPVAGDDVATTDEDAQLAIPLATLLGNDVDVDDVESITSVQNAINGSVTIVGSDAVFDPTPDFAGTASFTYTLTGGALTDEGTVTITVDDGNEPVVAVNDSADTDEDLLLVIPAATLLANDSDPDGTPVLETVQGAVNGTVVINGTDVEFTPADDFFGAASFTYTIGDGSSTDTATVSVTVDPVDDPPVAENDLATTNEDTAVTIAMATLLANDVDIDDVESITSVQGAVNGAAVLSGTDVVFTPTAEFAGTASFTYTLTGGTATDDATVTVTVNPVVDCPDGAPDAGEECDDGNGTASDGCENDCTFSCASGSGADDVVVDAVTGHCYAVFDGDAVTWAAAESFCEGLAGYLPVVADAPENTLIAGMTVATDNPWLGAIDPQDDNTFQWVNGDAFVFQPWAAGQPDDGFGAEDCVHLWEDAPGGSGWNDTNCGFAGFVTGVVCEIESVPCGDGVHQAAIGEACDDGNLALDDGCSPACQLEPRLVINEVDYDNLGTDSAEFIEIFNAGPGPAFLADYAVVLVNGANNAQYGRFNLTSAGAVLPPGGYLLIANTNVVAPPGTLRINVGTDTVQNGAPDGIGLFRIADSALKDALSYEGQMTAAVTDFGTVSFAEGAGTPLADSNTIQASMARTPNGTDTNNALTDWALPLVPTPGAAN